jgi:dipeptidyl aminopeptidase/acylaminoacyl peptidase
MNMKLLMKPILTWLLLAPVYLFAQKKSLDHTVYDSWQSIGEQVISNNGKWVAYTVTPQEGDAMLHVRQAGGTFRTQVPRGYNALITEDSRFLVFRIRPTFKSVREARIKKRPLSEMPKDSIGIMELGKEGVIRVAAVRSFKAPEKAAGWIAYHKEKPPVPPTRTAPNASQKTIDSLRKTIDSLVLLVGQVKNIKAGSGDDEPFADDPVALAAPGDGSDLVLRNLKLGKDQTFKNVTEYYFDEGGSKLVMEISTPARDSFSRSAVVVYKLATGQVDTILKGANDIRNFALSRDGSRLAFLAERDTSSKGLPKAYQLYFYEDGYDNATLLCDRKTPGMQLGMSVSENGNLAFSRSGNRLFFGTAPVQPLRDTSLVEIDLVKLDIWHYNDDYLQSQQLFQLSNELRRNYLALYDISTGRLTQLGSKAFPNVIQTNEGDGNYFVAVTDTGRRVARQWGEVKFDVYALDPATGQTKLVKRNHQGQVYPSSTGKYVLLYDARLKHYFAWDGTTLKNISSKIKTPLYNEEHDTPSDPSPYGLMGWHDGDSAVYVYDRYDVWRLDPKGVRDPYNVLQGRGRKMKDIHRYVQLDPEKRSFSSSDRLLFRITNYNTKMSSLAFAEMAGSSYARADESLGKGDFFIGQIRKASNEPAFVYTKESFVQSPDVYYSVMTTADGKDARTTVKEEKLSSINEFQSGYNWGTAEMFRWKTFDGKESSGILYKPEDFDSTKKYPMLIYFYERMSDNLYRYVEPSPTPSRLNIPFFVSRGYLVFTPDISYTKGHPAKDAYNYIVSGAQALARKKWVDAKNIGIQGQSWGGYQVLALLTQTPMFKAAWAGAPVANMFSAYGGIRWESGVNRQFQYEKGQSRIGATPWEKPDLYIENSPFFQLPKVKTPLVIMANDADGAVPWYQGIELFTAMRRLGKQVWMLNYNGEAHNLIERKNRKDIQIRQQQYFDWLLKGEKPARWITEGVPAVKKGREWGLEIE